MIRFFQILIFGPFFSIKQQWKRSIGLLLLIGILTLITQVGGLILWGSLPMLDAIHLRHPLTRWGVNIMVVLAVYLVSLVLFVPLLAPLGGRVPLPWFATSETPLQPANIGYCLLARNYVRPSVRHLLQRVAVAVSHQYPDTTVMYLDANFPFLNRFPLLPHLRHHDGKKIDLAYFYRDTTTKAPLNTFPSPIGYWAYEQPQPHESQPCQGVHNWLRWDLQWLQPAFAFAEIDPERTRALLEALIEDAASQKLFIEPHLKTRLQITSSKVRFQDEKTLSMALFFLDVFDYYLTTSHFFPESYSFTSERWEAWIIDVFANSPILRKYFETVKTWYPQELSDLFEKGKAKKPNFQQQNSK